MSKVYARYIELCNEENVPAPFREVTIIRLASCFENVDEYLKSLVKRHKDYYKQ